MAKDDAHFFSICLLWVTDFIQVEYNALNSKKYKVKTIQFFFTSADRQTYIWDPHVHVTSRGNGSQWPQHLCLAQIQVIICSYLLNTYCVSGTELYVLYTFSCNLHKIGHFIFILHRNTESKMCDLTKVTHILRIQTQFSLTLQSYVFFIVSHGFLEFESISPSTIFSHLDFVLAQIRSQISVDENPIRVAVFQSIAKEPHGFIYFLI